MNNDSLTRGAKILSFPLLFLGCLFICTPNVNLFDLLPDAIGYGLLLLAIRRAGEVFQHFDAAYRGFYTLFWINVAKIPATVIMMYITGIDLEERGLITVFALGFAIVEWIFAIPAFRNLFEGFAYLGEREGVLTALRTSSGKSVDSLAVFSFVFLIIKGAASFLPECVFLSTFDYNGSLEPGAVNPAVFYPFLAIGGFLITLVTGLIWLFSVNAYLSNLKRDPEMQALLLGKAELLAPELHAADERRHRRLFLFFLTAGFIFAIDPLIGNRDLLPNALAAISFFFAFRFAEGNVFPKRGKILSILYLFVSLTENVFTTLFFADFKLTDVAFRDAALYKYAPVVGLRFLESVLLILTVLALASILKEFIVANTGKALRPEDLVLRNEIHEELLARTKKLSFLSVIYALARPVSAALMAVTTRHIITEEEANEFYSEGTTVYSSAFAWLWILLLVFGIALAVYAIFLVGEIKSETGLQNSDKNRE